MVWFGAVQSYNMLIFQFNDNWILGSVPKSYKIQVENFVSHGRIDTCHWIGPDWIGTASLADEYVSLFSKRIVERHWAIVEIRVDHVTIAKGWSWNIALVNEGCVHIKSIGRLGSGEPVVVERSNTQFDVVRKCQIVWIQIRVGQRFVCLRDQGRYRRRLSLAACNGSSHKKNEFV